MFGSMMKKKKKKKKGSTTKRNLEKTNMLDCYTRFNMYLNVVSCKIYNNTQIY